MPGKDNLNYKFKDIKVFGSTEWLANNEKKYRLVYDEAECSFIYCELSFFNKKFDEEDWDVKIQIKCYKNDGSLICDLKADRKISKEENIVYIREGWGVKTPGSYWKRGSYRWEAWIDGEPVGGKDFFVEKEGLVTESINNYFHVKNVRLYEGLDANVPKGERKYLKHFNAKDTRYVWVEITSDNLIKKYEHWMCEFFFNFKTHSGQLKGSIDKLQMVTNKDDEFICTIGWGSDHRGTWGQDMYTVEIVFMDQIVAYISFEVGDAEIEATVDDEVIVPVIAKTPASDRFKQEAENMDEVMKSMDELIGLESIKAKIKDYTNYLNFIRLRKDKGFEDEDKINLHAVFTGNPGTGKTTVAKMLGKIYKKLGLLSKGHVFEVDRSDLVAEFIGQTAPKTKEAIKKAKGGILFIDEAYALARKNDDSKDFGKEVIEILLKEMSDGDGDIAIIAAGYPEEMNNFLASNPGLKSRFNMYYEFPDYTPQELMLIAEFSCGKKNILFNGESREFLYKKLVESYRERDSTFGNARYVNSLIDEAKMNMGLRVMQSVDPAKLSKEELSTITVADLEKIFGVRKRMVADIPIDEDLLKSSLNSLHNMIGLDPVKNEIDELVKLVRFYREIGKDVRQTFSLHTVFTGNPGTGKTTVARILAHIYKSLGILERGNLVECDRQGLVGGYIGQTAIKTNEILERAMGGVLFIDEAYSLTEGGENDYGREAIETILKRMEDRRGDFVVIAAGYTDNMRRFLESNPGLKSRFDKELHFDDYSATQLYDIAVKMFADNNIKPDKECAKFLKNFLSDMHAHKDKYCGNARSVRRIVEEAIKNQHLRLAKLDAAKRTSEMIKILALADVEEFKVDKDAGDKNTPSIGFKINS
ncbi:MAG: AAA family ATPase [Bacteroidia bacterium]|nr:AAA family ATPase [Bacteroidia bacterium]